MSVNQDKIIAQYSSGKEDGKANCSRSSSLEFYYTKKHLEGFISKTDRVLELGCASGYYGFYYARICLEYVGVDIVPAHIELFDRKIRDSGLQNISCRIGDATNASRNAAECVKQAESLLLRISIKSVCMRGPVYTTMNITAIHIRISQPTNLF